MKSRILILCGILIAALGVTLPPQVHAEKILHHGMAVEADASARDCMTCHDGAEGKNISYCTVKCGFSDSHSVEKHYPPAGKERLYAPLAVILAKGIKVIDGNITCISCHNLRKKVRYHLVMDNSRSQLCLACHIRE